MKTEKQIRKRLDAIVEANKKHNEKLGKKYVKLPTDYEGIEELENESEVIWAEISILKWVLGEQ